MKMFSRLPRLVIRDGAVTLPGKRYDLARTLYAYETIIDVLTGRYGVGGRSKIDARLLQLPEELLWPHPDKDVVLAGWRRYKTAYDALGAYVTHRIGPITVRAYVLGRNWTVYHPDRDALTTASGGDPLGLDHSPSIDIFGTSGGQATGLNEKGYDMVAHLLKRELSRFGLELTTTTMEDARAFAVTVHLTFPHQHFGAGEDWIRVRCIAPNGAELVPQRQPD